MREPERMERLHFYRGMLVGPDEWLLEQAYHIEARALHARSQHAPGVVRARGDELVCRPHPRDAWAVEVSAGVAVDGAGRSMVVEAPRVVRLDPARWARPMTAYLVASLCERREQFTVEEDFPQMAGYRRVVERCSLTFVDRPADEATEVELCRVTLSAETRALRLPRDPRRPQPGELDARFVPLAGVCGSVLSPRVRVVLVDALYQAERALWALASRTGDAPTATAAAIAASTALALEAGRVPRWQVAATLGAWIRSQVAAARSVEQRFPELYANRLYAAYAQAIACAEEALGRNAGADDDLEPLAVRCEAIAKALAAFGGGGADLGPRVETPAGEVDLAAWHAVRDGAEAPAERMQLGGVTWRLVDVVDLGDAASERAHGVRWRGGSGCFRARQRLRYPAPKGAEPVEDQGAYWSEGDLEFELHGLHLLEPLVLVVRIDYRRGGWRAAVHAGDQRVADWVVEGRDAAWGWRNWPLFVDGAAVDAPSLTIRISLRGAARDANAFRVWAYQPEGAAAHPPAEVE